MVERLQGKRVLVTGAGQGIGRAITLACAQEGATVIATSRTPSKLRDLPDASPAISVAALDVTDDVAVSAVVAASGPVDVLIHAAGWVASGTILDCSPEDWQRSLDQNATSAYRMMRAVLPGMLDRGRGTIVNVASVASSLTGVAGRTAYGASKAALIGLSKAVARDFIGRGIRCNVLCPGTTDTPSLAERISANPDAEAARKAMIARHPIGRLATVEEMAAAAVFLASDESGFMTGQLLVIDGGQTL
ncbi:MAG: SDR family oxidoreductase [Phreatobacter sp.]|uniref:SDR family oxidoreductase n=1 Tax=Phreatobacter sp. TaxID=1966341 RepID=UPI0040355B6B